MDKAAAPLLAPRYRHKKRGTDHEVIGTACLQTERPIADGKCLAVYRDEKGMFWVRPLEEFLDGRFEKIPGPPPSGPLFVTGFPNLAQGEEDRKDPEKIARASEICRLELEAAGIPVEQMGTTLGGEVPSLVIGSLSKWWFRRAWYYWMAQGPGIPIEAAEKLHRDFGSSVRVDGDASAPSPREQFSGFGVGHYHIDSPQGLRALADVIKSVAAGGA